MLTGVHTGAAGNASHPVDINAALLAIFGDIRYAGSHSRTGVDAFVAPDALFICEN